MRPAPRPKRRPPVRRGGRASSDDGRPRRAPRQALGGVEGLQPARQTEPVARTPGAQAPRSVADIGYLAVPDSASFTLRHHLAAVATRYPGTPYAERALLLATALPIPLPPDSTAADSTSADSTAADSTATPAPPDALVGDSLAAPSDSAAVAQPPVAADLSGLRGDAPPDPSSGGFTWRVQRVTIVEEAQALVRVLEAAGFRAAVLRDDETLVVVVGQFKSQDEAQAAQTALPAWAQIRGEVVSLSYLLSVSTAAPDRGDL